MSAWPIVRFGVRRSRGPGRRTLQHAWPRLARSPLAAAGDGGAHLRDSTDEVVVRDAEHGWEAAAKCQAETRLQRFELSEQHTAPRGSLGARAGARAFRGEPPDSLDDGGRLAWSPPSVAGGEACAAACRLAASTERFEATMSPAWRWHPSTKALAEARADRTARERAADTGGNRSSTRWPAHLEIGAVECAEPAGRQLPCPELADQASELGVVGLVAPKQRRGHGQARRAQGEAAERADGGPAGPGLGRGRWNGDARGAVLVLVLCSNTVAAAPAVLAGHQTKVAPWLAQESSSPPVGPPPGAAVGVSATLIDEGPEPAAAAGRFRLQRNAGWLLAGTWSTVTPNAVPSTPWRGAVRIGDIPKNAEPIDAGAAAVASAAARDRADGATSGEASPRSRGAQLGSYVQTER